LSIYFLVLISIHNRHQP